MDSTLLDFTKRLVPISDFSQGKSGKIFSDVAQNNNKYVVLKNNQPTAILMSIKEYSELQEKARGFEKLFDLAENLDLLNIAANRDNADTVSFESFINEQGISMNELKELAESVEFE